MADPVNAFLAFVPGLDLTVTTDQAILFHTSNYIVRRITFFNASKALNLATGGLYTGPNKTGTQLVSALQAYATLTANDRYLDVTLPAALTTRVRNESLLYFSLTTPELNSGAMDIAIWGDIVTLGG